MVFLKATLARIHPGHRFCNQNVKLRSKTSRLRQEFSVF